MADQSGAGSHALFQSFVVPSGIGSATLSFNWFVGNRDGNFITPNTLDFTSGPNQQMRVDILRNGAPDFSLAPADVLLKVFGTNPGDPLVSGYNLSSTNLTAFLQAHAGETLRIRFSEVDNQLFNQFGVDNVSLQVSAIPEPATFAVFGLMAMGAFGARRRLKAAA